MAKAVKKDLRNIHGIDSVGYGHTDMHSLASEVAHLESAAPLLPKREEEDVFSSLMRDKEISRLKKLFHGKRVGCEIE